MARLYQNFIGGTLTTDLLIGDTSLESASLASMREVVAPDTMTVTLGPETGTPELVLVTAHTAGATTATILRAQESTTEQDWLAATPTEWRHDWTAEAINESRVRVADVTGTTYTVLENDEGRVLRFTDAAAVTVTLPVGLNPGFLVHLLFVGAGGGTVASDGTSTVRGSGTAVAQYGEASCLVEATNTWNVQGAT